ncbi:unnamed protein product [Didymodactylos carnosus]|uniref:GH18 domain-containing protein n=1 Tax=Didymodactylos carnosus TaxID=1234261 RepID=A0A8S2DDR4_9BILA|nr:unnamed protein product [Didymodactylos carnosus]CAF3716135.1 unnamed protein product [Didymodactylos carnosus]
MRLWFLVHILLICWKKWQINAKMRVVCYYANWSLYREAMPILYPDQIDPTLCTHIHYAFADIDPLTLNIIPTELHDVQWTDRHSMPLYLRMYGLKRRNPSLKIILAVGGWTARSKGFNAVLRSDTSRAKFINQTIQYINEWNFDGLDLDWEFPGDRDRDAAPDSQIKFDILVKDLYQAFNDEVKKPNNTRQRLILTAAVAADPKKIDHGYIVQNLCGHLDYVNIMTYDYHGKNSSIYYWLERGCPAEKMNLGLAIYGRTFTLADEVNNTLGSPVSEGGEAGPYTKEEGILAYFEICQKLRANNWTTEWDHDSQAQYAYYENQWVGYDSLRSATLKVIWAKTLGLGGAMLWTLDYDDYTGLFCGRGMFPFTKRVHETMFDDVITSATASNLTDNSTPLSDTSAINLLSTQIIDSKKQSPSSTIINIYSSPLSSRNTTRNTKIISDHRIKNDGGERQQQQKFYYSIIITLWILHEVNNLSVIH